MNSFIISVFTHRLTITFGIIVLGVLLRELVTRRIRRSKNTLDYHDRRKISNVQYISTGVVLMTVVALWLPQIQHFVLSVTAIAVALVIATKELIYASQVRCYYEHHGPSRLETGLLPAIGSVRLSNAIY